MRIDPIDTSDKDPFGHLTLTQKISRWVAIVAAFVGVVIWAIKIVF